MRKLWILASLAVLYALPSSAQAQFIGTDGVYNMNRTTGNTFNSIVGVGNAALVVSGDDNAFTFNFAAPFTFYGTPATSASVSTNGLFTFGGTSNTAFTNSALTATNPTAPSLAPYWDDLIGTDPQGVYVQTAGTTTTVEWQMGYFSGGGTAAFQVIFNSSNGSMTVNYGDISTGAGANAASATVGIKGISTFIQAGFNTPGTVITGDRLLITQAVPEPTSLALVGIAGVGMVWRRLRRKA
jgi:hypothetical protein